MKLAALYEQRATQWSVSLEHVIIDPNSAQYLASKSGSEDTSPKHLARLKLLVQPMLEGDATHLSIQPAYCDKQ